MLLQINLLVTIENQTWMPIRYWVSQFLGHCFLRLQLNHFWAELTQICYVELDLNYGQRSPKSMVQYLRWWDSPWWNYSCYSICPSQLQVFIVPYWNLYRLFSYFKLYWRLDYLSRQSWCFYNCEARPNFELLIEEEEWILESFMLVEH